MVECSVWLKQRWGPFVRDCPLLGCQAVVDTGSSLLMAPGEVVEALNKKLKINENCTNFDKLPTVRP